MLGGQTLVELRTALFEAELAEEGGVSPRVSPTAELGDAAALLQRAGFAMPVADSETITVTYPDLLALMRDLRGMGETNALAARRRASCGRATLARAGAIYAERFADADGRIPATFEMLFLTGWAPRPDKPNPAPGRAGARSANPQCVHPGEGRDRWLSQAPFHPSSGAVSANRNGGAAATWVPAFVGWCEF